MAKDKIDPKKDIQEILAKYRQAEYPLNSNMKTVLTHEESEKLFSLGFTLEDATIHRVECPARTAGFRDEYLFTLIDIFKLLPPTITIKFSTLSKTYIVWDEYNHLMAFGAELIDALTDILIQRYEKVKHTLSIMQDEDRRKTKISTSKSSGGIQ